jgi:hypothetical protein
MTLPSRYTEKHRKAKNVTVIERIEGYYAPEEVAFGVVYRWQPGYVLIECGCGKMLTLNRLMATCRECGTDHAAVVREELTSQCSEDEAIHPWRYSKDREGLGLPF